MWGRFCVVFYAALVVGFLFSGDVSARSIVINKDFSSKNALSTGISLSSALGIPVQQFIRNDREIGRIFDFAGGGEDLYSLQSFRKRHDIPVFFLGESDEGAKLLHGMEALYYSSPRAVIAWKAGVSDGYVKKCRLAGALHHELGHAENDKIGLRPRIDNDGLDSWKIYLARRVVNEASSYYRESLTVYNCLHRNLANRGQLYKLRDVLVSLKDPFIASYLYAKDGVESYAKVNSLTNGQKEALVIYSTMVLNADLITPAYVESYKRAFGELTKVKGKLHKVSYSLYKPSKWKKDNDYPDMDWGSSTIQGLTMEWVKYHFSQINRVRKKINKRPYKSYGLKRVALPWKVVVRKNKGVLLASGNWVGLRFPTKVSTAYAVDVDASLKK